MANLFNIESQNQIPLKKWRSLFLWGGHVHLERRLLVSGHSPADPPTGGVRALLLPPLALQLPVLLLQAVGPGLLRSRGRLFGFDPEGRGGSGGGRQNRALRFFGGN